VRAAIFHEPRRIDAGQRADPTLRDPTDAIVRVVLACVCGSDEEMMRSLLTERIHRGASLTRRSIWTESPTPAPRWRSAARVRVGSV
jgi:hypothetical protein